MVYLKYRKILKISPGAYIFQRPFLRGLFFEGLIFGGAYLRREICLSKSIGQALYSQTCIKRSPSIKRSPVKVPEIAYLIYCKLDLH